MPATYCKKCSNEIRKSGGKPDEILDGNRVCILCEEPEVCPNCSGEQEVPRRLLCADCLTEADRYSSGVAEVNEDINSTLRLREAQGWTPSYLVVDATLRDGPVDRIPLTPGMIINLNPLSMIFAVGVFSLKGKEAQVDFVELCPAPLKEQLRGALQNEASISDIRVVQTPLRSKG